MKKLILSVAVVSSISFISCEKKEAVAVQDAQETAVATEGAAAYTVDNTASTVTWRGYKIYEGETEEQGHYGTMPVKSGEIHTENGQITAGDFIIDPTMLVSHDLEGEPEDKAKLEGHLKSEDFLDVERYPEATFNITNVAAIEGPFNTEISGNFKLREVEKNITFKANVKEDADKVTLDSEEFTINRQDFGITFKGGKGSVIKDNVTIKVNVVANK